MNRYVELLHENVRIPLQLTFTQSLKHVEKALYAAKIPHVVPQRIDYRTLKIPMPKYVNLIILLILLLMWTIV